MRKGYGQFLIEFSYLLTRVEKKTGSPEKPLSDMGLVSYRKYWRLVLCQELLDQKKPISITAISERTGMTPDDIVSALEGLRALVRDPVTKTYALRLDYTYFKQYIEKCNANNNPKINPECLVWTPYVMGRLGQYEDGPALHTVQQREEPDEEAKVDGVAGVSKAEKAAGKNGVPNGNPSGAEDEGESTTPPLPAEESTNGETPQPSTPVANGPNGTVNGSQGAGADLSIPPTRFEVFPPIPGMPNGKRRPGRPFGSRRRTTTPSQNRRASLTLAATAPPARQRFSPSRNGNGKGSPTTNGKRTPSTSLRRTRSRLGESVVNGISSDEVADGGAVKAINGYRNGNKAKGKGLFDAAHDENGHAETDDDVDADGEMDVDAEGEYDEAADVAMANA
jgi:histone acetyltransferase SAS3